MPGKILVGTASWADPGFIADWYPRDLPASERLPYYAEHFNLVELNSSFYAIPARKIVQRWCKQTPRDFTFDVKLHRLLSRHKTKPANLPPELRSSAQLQGQNVHVTPELETALTQTLLKELEPLVNSGKLGAFLLQLTPAFSPQRNRLEELDHLLGLLAAYPVAVELRNSHWVAGEQLSRTQAFFRKRKITFVSVDAPETEHFMVMPSLDEVSHPNLAYLRLHGRNAKGYVSGRTVAERFDYLYSNRELEEIALRTLKLAEEAARTHVIYNNNASDHAIQNASSFQKMLAKRHPQTVTRMPAHPDAGRRKGQRTLEFAFTRDAETKP